MTDQVIETVSSIKETPLPVGFTISVDHWLMSDHISWTEAAQKGDVITLNQHMSTAVQQWPFKGLYCNNADDYKKLTAKQWTKVVKAVGLEVNNAFLE